MLVELYQEILKEAGIEVLGFTEASAYWRELESGRLAPPAVLCTDLAMPDLSGHELIRRVREAFPETRIIIVSGYDPEGSRTRVCHRLAKPVLPEALIETVRTALRCVESGAACVLDDCRKLAGDDPDWSCPEKPER